MVTYLQSAIIDSYQGANAVIVAKCFDDKLAMYLFQDLPQLNEALRTPESFNIQRTYIGISMPAVCSLMNLQQELNKGFSLRDLDSLIIKPGLYQSNN